MFFKKRYIGITITDKIQAYMKGKGIIFDDYTSNIITVDDNKLMNIPNYWLEKDKLEKLLKAALKKQISTIKKPKLFLCIPHELEINDAKEIILNTAGDIGCSEMYVVSNVITAAVGCGVPIHEANKNIFIYNIKGKTYFALLYIGAIFNILTIQKDILQIGEEEFLLKINNLLSSLPHDISEKISHIKDKEIKEKLLRRWKLNPTKEIYLCIPEDDIGQLDPAIGAYKLKKLEYKDCIINGLANIMNEIEI